MYTVGDDHNWRQTAENYCQLSDIFQDKMESYPPRTRDKVKKIRNHLGMGQLEVWVSLTKYTIGLLDTPTIVGGASE